MTNYMTESSDSEYEQQYNIVLNLSYRMLDDEGANYHLRNSIYEQELHRQKYNQDNKEVRSDAVKDKFNDDYNSTDDRTSQQSDSVYNGAFNVPLHSANNDIEFTSDKEYSIRSKDISHALSESLREDLCPFSDVTSNEEVQVFDNVTESLLLNNNYIMNVPIEVLLFRNLKSLDLSNNSISYVNDFTTNITSLRSIFFKQNALADDSLPKDMSLLINLKEINISGNNFTRVPEQLYHLPSLKYLYAGNNQISVIPQGIKALKNLQVLQLGGNILEEVPDELGELSQLTGLVLCDNKLQRLPRAISQLKRLRSLLLHRNKICCLPVEIVKLRGLTELSLRENPLVTKFVNSCAMEIMFNPPTLKELAARVISSHKIPYGPQDLPHSLHYYLKSGHQCVNPKCKGVYFTSCVEHIKFVDFCGKYRVPLMHYLCSSRCSSQTPVYYKSSSTTSDSDSDEDLPSRRMKKVLLG